MKDYYAVLGVRRDATQEEIKGSFRRLARETHPDSNPDDPDAELRFREVAEAYEVLSDPARRRAYDRGDEFDISGLFSSFAGFDELLSRFFGGHFTSAFDVATSGPDRGADVGVTVELTLEEAAFGTSRQVSYPAETTCSACESSGSEPGTPLRTCDRCGGQGVVRLTRQTFLGTTVSMVGCDRCGGRGRLIQDPCRHCQGRGVLAGEQTVTVEVPAGVDDGARLRLFGKGSSGELGAPPGDLYVEIRVAPDERFHRRGEDLVHRLRIGLAEAALGIEATVPMIDGDGVVFEVPPGTQPGTVFRFARRGVPRLRHRGRGDLLVEVDVVVPEDLDTEQEEALRRYAEVRGEQPAKSRRRSGFRRAAGGD